jgi:hypothetical protein
MQIISKKYKIEFSGIYHYDEEFLNGSEKDRARLTIIDSVTNAILIDEIIDELTYEVKRNFIHNSLK